MLIQPLNANPELAVIVAIGNPVFGSGTPILDLKTLLFSIG